MMTLVNFTDVSLLIGLSLFFVFASVSIFCKSCSGRKLRMTSAIASLGAALVSTSILVVLYETGVENSESRHPIIVISTSPGDAAPNWYYELRSFLHYSSNGSATLSFSFMNAASKGEEGGPAVTEQDCLKVSCNGARIRTVVTFVGFENDGDITCGDNASLLSTKGQDIPGVTSALYADLLGGAGSATNWNGTPLSGYTEDATELSSQFFSTYSTDMGFYWNTSSAPILDERDVETSDGQSLAYQEVCRIPPVVNSRPNNGMVYDLLTSNITIPIPQVNFTSTQLTTDWQKKLTSREYIDARSAHGLSPASEFQYSFDMWHHDDTVFWNGALGESSNFGWTEPFTFSVESRSANAARAAAVSLVGISWAIAMAFFVRSLPQVRVE